MLRRFHVTGPGALTFLTNMINEILQEGKVPESLQTGKMTLIEKNKPLLLVSAHLPGSNFDLVVTTIFLISIFTHMKPKEKLVRKDDEIILGPILNCSVKYCWHAS